MDDAPVNWLPILVRGDVTDWERQFCASLIAQTKRGRRISDKQAKVLTRIRDQYRERTMRDDDLIESSHDAER
jgi:hypothetical protein